MSQPHLLLGLKLDSNLQVLEVKDGGSCSGRLQIDDRITHIDNESVVGKKPSDLLEMCKSSVRILIGFERLAEGSSNGEKTLHRVAIRLPVSRPVLTRNKAREQIQAGQRIRADDAELRRVFRKFSVQSVQIDQHAHIRKEILFEVLRKLDWEVGNQEEYFLKHDLDGDGVINIDEFREVMHSLQTHPQHHEIRQAFDEHASEGKDGHFICRDRIATALGLLPLRKRDAEKALAYFELGALNDDQIGFDEFQQAILSVSPIPDEQEIEKVFHSYAIPGSPFLIPNERLEAALLELGVSVTGQELATFSRIVTLNFEGCINYSAFKHIVSLPSPLEVWAKTLPLAGLLADALPKHGGIDHMRVISSMTSQEIEIVAEELGEALKGLLRQHISRIRTAYIDMDNFAVKAGVHLCEKFEVPPIQRAEAGGINNYYEGLEARIGACPSCFEEAMMAEHCYLPGCDFSFTTLNYTEIQTCPRREWDIVSKKVQCEKGEMLYNRRIPDIDKLLEQPLAQNAKLRRAEVISIVLYTGPMYIVYNTILRKQQAELFERFKKADNLFPTTIFVLSSAILNVSRVMKLHNGLVLYRGLGGTTDLPDSFFKLDQFGCRGFSEYAFMSTTACKQVAINYCGINKQKPLPLVLAIRVGATDRGACIREFSQYMSEVEYIFAPCSFIEPDGPDYLEVSKAGVVRIIPVRVRAGAKSCSVQELEVKKRTLHLAAFKYRLHEIELRLLDLARTHHAEERLDKDPTRAKLTSVTVESFVKRIVQQCEDVYLQHAAVSAIDYNDDRRFRSLVLEMVELRVMAVAKLREWIENTKGAFICYRFEAKLRTAHRRWITYLQRKLQKTPEDKMLALQLLKTRGLIVDSVDETNELGETRLMAASAEGRYSVVRMLVEASAKVDCSRADGVSAIWLAALCGQNQTIETLISFKANVDQCARNGASPTYIAAQMGNSICIEVLHRYKADVNLADIDEVSPMHMAAMNGRSSCVELLHKLKARLDGRAKNGMTPLDLAMEQSHQNCAAMIKSLLDQDSLPQSSPFQQELDSFPSKPTERLIITTGDVSDVDGFFALAEYAKTGADVLFVMNYPAYIGVSDAEACEERSREYAINNPGLGYRYSAAEVLKCMQEVSPRPKEYDDFLSRYDPPGSEGDNWRMKSALTDLAFCMAVQVWKEANPTGRLSFHIGGVNSINPFSQEAIKNEVFVYTPLVTGLMQEHQPKLKAEQGLTYDTDGKLIRLSIQNYANIYIDFNGSMAFWTEDWAELLSRESAKSLRGAFIMGGVHWDKEPVTSPPNPGRLNRFSSATMNQLYHPERAAAFFQFLEQRNVPAFIVANNSVHDLTTTSPDADAKTYEGVERFLNGNGLTGSFLRRFAQVHYESRYTPPRKPYDFYTARALTMWLESKKDFEHLCGKRLLFYSNVFGISIVSGSDSWKATKERYANSLDTMQWDEDSADVQSRKKYFAREMEVLRGIEYAGRLAVFDVCLDMDTVTSELKAPK